MFTITPELNQLFTVNSPMDLIGIGFFLLTLYVIIGGTFSMYFNQIKCVMFVIKNRSPLDLGSMQPYTRSIIAGTAPEVARLQTVKGKERRDLLKSVIMNVERDTTPVAKALASALKRKL